MTQRFATWLLARLGKMSQCLPYTHHCFVCGTSNPHGLQLRFHTEPEDHVIHSDYIPSDHHAGYPGVLHGGAVAAVLDEAMLWAATHATGRMQMSVELAVRYRGKTLTGSHHRIVARFVRQRATMCSTTAELLDAAGDVCATASGKYLPLPREDAARVLADVCSDAATLSLRDFVAE